MNFRTTAYRGHWGAVAALLAGGALLTAACSSDSAADRTASHSSRGGQSHDEDRSRGQSRGQGQGQGQGQGPEQGRERSREPGADRALPGEERHGKRKAPVDHLSTFALDVDTASYGYARRTLADGRRPDPGDIRPEEFVNSFRQDYPAPDGDGFSVTLDGARPGAAADDEPHGEFSGEVRGETRSEVRGEVRGETRSEVRGEVRGETRSEISGAAGETRADSSVPDPDPVPDPVPDPGLGRDPGEDWSLVRVGLATRPAASTAERPPAALTFVVDVSGSMAEPGRLDLVRESLGVLTDELRDDDSIAVVTFSGHAETRLPMTRIGGGRERIRAVVDGLRPGDSTDVEAGMTAGYETAVAGRRPGATNRVVLLSDALANTGSTDADAILERIGDARRDHGITLFGVGVGSDYGDALMERLADRGDGHTTYVSTGAEARDVFRRQLPAHVELRARDAKAQVAFDPANVERFRLIGYENRAVADEDFRDDGVDGGEVGPGHTVTALYAVLLRPGASGHVATATVRWLDPVSRAPRERSGSIEAAGVDGALWGEASSRLQVTAAAAYFAERLRGGSAPGMPTLGELGGHARTLARTTDDDAVAELADAIGHARRLTG
ncbi:von Willebrand factor type A domain-containing protein [Streptomyces sp. NPDC020141]|uniref:YfbK domain-containing protein n=1 Tax=Streptomyces sp. NPDC020141 TaxID=3365065 RepID=UPI0037BBD00C